MYRSILYYMATTFTAVFLGIILVVSIQPGANVSIPDPTAPLKIVVLTADTLMDLVRFDLTHFFFTTFF